MKYHLTSCFLFLGKGISDQDRNILSNQIMLLDFLKTAAPLLEEGAIPSLNLRICSKRSKDSDGKESEEGDMLAEMDMIQKKERGTILITLRNGPPYTLW
jgi:25S rRNA (uracil2634-N3)-methyltransferase